MRSKFFRLTASLFALCAASCTVSRTEPPPVTGPSALATSLTVTASPDTLLQDGASQSSIVVTAIGPNGRPLSNISIRLNTAIDGVPQDFGTLAARTIVTGSDGRAATVYTAPAMVSPLLGGSGTMVSVQATAIGFDATMSPSRGIPSVDIRLVPPGVILPPADTPTAQFTFTPATPQANSPVAFDASASCGGRADTNGCLPSNFTVVSYSWTFGDGATGSGRTATHTYTSPGPYNATLTVTNDRGLAASTTKQVTVGAGTPPTAAFVFGPTPANVGQEVFFDASQSRAAAGHTIVEYKWNFGDGTLKDRTTPLTQHDWTSSGVFVVRLTVVDEAGQEGTATQTITIGSGAPTPSFTVVVTNPGTHSVQADGSASTASGGATVTGYTFSWGDGTSTAGGAIQSHSYGAAGTYPVTLTVTDSLGRSGASTATSVIVP
jgi:PKD repeat protein